MQFLGVIPARGGSKGIPKKNIAPLRGRPLLAYTCAAALGSASLSDIVLSTDDQEIEACAKKEGISTVIPRPPDLAADETPMLDVLRHLLGVCDERKIPADAVVLLQPTSPLRTAAHIDGAIERFREKNADTLVSVIPVPHRFTPESLMRQNDDGTLAHSTPQEKIVLLRQHKQPLFARNGPAILIVRRKQIENGSFYDGTVIPYLMTAEESVDIDTKEDLAYAEYLLGRQ